MILVLHPRHQETLRYWTVRRTYDGVVLMRVGLGMSSALLWSGSTIALFAAAVMAEPMVQLASVPAPQVAAPTMTPTAITPPAPVTAPAPVAPTPVFNPLRQAIEQWDGLRRD